MSDRIRIKDQFKEALRYTGANLIYVYIVLLLFIVSGVIGFVFNEQFGYIDILIRDLILRTQDLGTVDLIFFILQNNLLVSLFALVFGVALGIFPIINSITNGIVVGYVMNKVYIVGGLIEFWRLLPHGIFELPAVFISMGLGLKLGMFVFRKNKRETLRERFYQCINVFLFIVIPLLIIAAIIEGLLIGLFS